MFASAKERLPKYSKEVKTEDFALVLLTAFEVAKRCSEET